ncbi:hypothetical protein LCGC14_1467340 [marine sediment metagenome]|uniref:Phosphoribosyltransferase domain-containing protein n=1 Tax=marine sediment metagenome TaxID=412755 RepID=A0A0F9JE02_9ZZZZ|nr:bifunctional pyr operon transcriptional regulator/uracil phosphoribosyltransferase PyrR [Actinomycetota bacterium]
MATILDKDQLKRALTRIAHEILENNRGPKNVVLVGIQSRGYHLAVRLAENIKKIESQEVPVGALDISLYRDDVGTNPQPILKKTEIDFDLTDKRIVVVDDVLYTGRTIRAAMDALMDLGRPASIQLAALIDRGHRELPIRPDYIGKNIPTATKERVNVKLKEEDGDDSVALD